MTGKFGWSYPPGAANDPMAPYNQQEDDVHCVYCGADLPDDVTAIRKLGQATLDARTRRTSQGITQ
jgi:hypothetical protein